MKKLILLSLLLAFGISCNNDDPIDLNDINIRIINSSSQTFKSVYVHSGNGVNTYVNIRPGQSSDYKSYTEAYRYGYIEVKTLTKEYKIQPFDYVGETVLKSGKYSYQLSIVENKLELTFSKD